MGNAMVERRGQQRGRVSATAIAWADDRGPIHYVVEDLSASGARLVDGDALPIGQRVSLSLDIASEGVLDLEAVVVRHGDGLGGSIAIAFVEVTPSDEDTIHQAVLRALEAHAMLYPSPG